MYYIMLKETCQTEERLLVEFLKDWIKGLSCSIFSLMALA